MLKKRSSYDDRIGPARQRLYAPVSYTHLDVYKRQLYVDDLVVESREGCLFTRNRLITAPESEGWRPLFDAIVHCNNAKRTRHPDGRSRTTGDPTETALLEFAADHGLLHRPPLRRMGEIPFDADRKRMTTLHWSEGRLLAFTKGAPESVLPLCTRQQGSSTPAELTVDGRKKVLAQSQAFAQQAYRVLAVAMREVERGAVSYTHLPPARWICSWQAHEA